MADANRLRSLVEKLREGAKLSRTDVFEIQSVADELENLARSRSTEHHSFATPHSYFSHHVTSALRGATGLLDEVATPAKG